MVGSSDAHPRRPRRHWAGLAVVALAGLVAGCGSGTGPQSVRVAATTTTPVTGPSAATSPGVTTPPKRVPEPEWGRLPELESTAHLVVTPWRLLSVTGGGRTLHLVVGFGCGLPPVGEHLEESPSAVTIIIYKHRLPAGFVCSGALGTAFVAVTLAAPLAGRRLTQ